MVRWSAQSLERRPLARQRRQPPDEKVAEGLAARVDIAAVAVDEVHRHVEHPVDIALEAHARLEDEGQRAAAVGIGVGPDMAPVAEEAVGPAFGEGRVGEERRGDRLQGQADPELADHVGFVREVEIDLHGAGAQHHVEAERADLGHVVAHDLVTALGHPGDGGAWPFGVEAHAQHGHAQGSGHLAHLVQMGVHLAAGLVQRLQRGTTQLELAARLERDAAAVLDQRDRQAGLQRRPPAELPRQALEQGPNPVRPLIGQRPEIRGPERELLMLGADTPVGPRLRALLEIFDQLALVADRQALALWRSGHMRFLPVSGTGLRAGRRPRWPALRPRRQRRCAGRSRRLRDHDRSC